MQQSLEVDYHCKPMQNSISYKHDRMPIGKSSDANTTLFTGNRADYGGAVYVDDNSGTCTSDPKTEYFFQVLALYPGPVGNFDQQCMYFLQINANTSSSTLYGGLLDRCALSKFAELYHHPSLP